jgi:formylglycine-generating enzyme required for sulfatase activity
MFISTAFGIAGCTKQEASSVTPEWVLIPGGKYMMGYPNGYGQPKDHPLHEETVKSFFMTKTEITVAEYDACIKDRVCWWGPEAKNKKLCHTDVERFANHPVTCMDWYQAAAYCAWVGGRLPTEAEWEYAARSGGKNFDAPWGKAPATCDRAVFDEKPGHNCGKWKGPGVSTSPVCSRPAGNSEQGVCDLLGNVIEWTNDWFYHNYDYESFEKIPETYSAETKESTYHRVMRGGGVGSDEPLAARNRIFHHPWFYFKGLGFRCVK